MTSLCVVGPSGHFWYKSLDKIVSRISVRGTARFIATKVRHSSKAPWEISNLKIKDDLIDYLGILTNNYHSQTHIKAK